MNTQEEAALQRAEELAEGARVATGAAMAQRWAELAENKEWKEMAVEAEISLPEQ